MNSYSVIHTFLNVAAMCALASYETRRIHYGNMTSNNHAVQSIALAQGQAEHSAPVSNSEARGSRNAEYVKVVSGREYVMLPYSLASDYLRFSVFNGTDLNKEIVKALSISPDEQASIRGAKALWIEGERSFESEIARSEVDPTTGFPIASISVSDESYTTLANIRRQSLESILGTERGAFLFNLIESDPQARIATSKRFVFGESSGTLYVDVFTRGHADGNGGRSSRKQRFRITADTVQYLESTISHILDFSHLKDLAKDYTQME